MKKDDVVAKIPCTILSLEQTSNLKLKEQSYIILIPKSLLGKIILSEDFLFDLIIKNNTVSLLGNYSKKVKQLPGMEVVT